MICPFFRMRIRMQNASFLVLKCFPCPSLQATVPVENRTQFSYDLAVDTAFEVMQDISRNNRIPDFAPDLSDHARTNFWLKVLSRWLPPHLPQNAVDTAPGMLGRYRLGRITHSHLPFLVYAFTLRIFSIF